MKATAAMTAMAPTATPTPTPAFAPVVSPPPDCAASELPDVVDIDVALAVGDAVMLLVCVTISEERHRIDTPFALIPSAEVVKLDVVPPFVKYQTLEWVFREVHRLVVCQSSVGDSVWTL